MTPGRHLRFPRRTRRLTGPSRPLCRAIGHRWVYLTFRGGRVVRRCLRCGSETTIA